MISGPKLEVLPPQLGQMSELVLGPAGSRGLDGRWDFVLTCWRGAGGMCWPPSSHYALPGPAAASFMLVAEGPWNEVAFEELALKGQDGKTRAQKLSVEFAITGGMAPRCSRQLRTEGKCLKGGWLRYGELNLLVLQAVVAGPLPMSWLSWSLKPVKAAF